MHRAWCYPLKNQTHDVKPEASTARTTPSAGKGVKILYDARQDASSSHAHKREVRSLRAPQGEGEISASHTTRGSLATGQTAALADRHSGGRPFAEKPSIYQLELCILSFFWSLTMNKSCLLIGDTFAGGGGRNGLVMRWYDSRWVVRDAERPVCL